MDAPASPASSAKANGLHRSDDSLAILRADERRVILDQYQDIIAQMNLPAETAARLQDLLTARVEAVLDAEDAAMQEGFAAGSAETARAVSIAISEFDRQIADLVGRNGNRQLDGLSPEVSPEPAAMPPLAPATVVNVVVQTAPPPAYTDAPSPAAAIPDTSSLYSSYPYPYYPVTSVLIGRGAIRPFARARSGIVRAYPSPFLEPVTRVAMRKR